MKTKAKTTDRLKEKVEKIITGSCRFHVLGEGCCQCDEDVEAILSLIDEEKGEAYKKGLDDMFLEIAKLAEPDERQSSAGDLTTNMDNIHDIRTKLKALVTN